MYIRTDRLILKTLSEADQAAVIRILTDDTVKKTYLLPDFQTEEQAIKLFNLLKAYSMSEKHYVRGIYLDEKLIGFLNDVEFRDGCIELGYVIHPDYHNQGYATEALRGVIRDLSDRGLSEVIAGAFEDNQASIRVMEKAGMSRLDRTEEIEYRGKVHRCVYYRAFATQKMYVNDKNYHIIKLLGHGKGGYSYLAEREGKQYVLKQIHHEPCDYYTFGNKIEAEKNDYQRLLDAGIRIPEMYDIDIEKERIVKEYIEGPTIDSLVKSGEMKKEYYAQVREMAGLARAAGLNIDYYPTNFVVQEGLLYYIDYECNTYMDEWSFENWGMQYW